MSIRIMGLGPVPAEVQDEIYQYITQVMKPEQMIPALVADYTQSQADFADNQDRDFEALLRDLSREALDDLLYETVITSNRFDPQSNTFFVDRGCQHGFRTDDLYRHYFVNALLAVGHEAGVVLRPRDLDTLSRKAEEAILAQRGKLTLTLGTVGIELHTARPALRLSMNDNTRAIEPMTWLATETAYRQWHERLGSTALSHKNANEESFAP